MEKERKECVRDSVNGRGQNQDSELHLSNELSLLVVDNGVGLKGKKKN